MTGGADLINALCKFFAFLYLAPGGMVASLHTPGRCFLIILRRRYREFGVGLVNDLPMQAVAEVGHIVVQPHKLRFRNGECRPFDCGIALNDGGLPARIAAGVLIGRISQNQIGDDRLILLKNFPNSGSFLRRGLFRKKAVIFHQTGKIPLDFGPREVDSRTFHSDGKGREVIAVLAPQPVRCILLTAMFGHVLPHPALAVWVAVPLPEGGINVVLGDLTVGNSRRTGRFHARPLRVILCIQL